MGVMNPGFSVPQKTVSFGLQTIHRRCGGDVQSAEAFATPGQSRRLLGHGDGAEVSSVRSADPNSRRAGHESIAFAVDLDSIRHTFVFLARFLAKNAAVGQRAIRRDIVAANVPLLAVI